MKRRTYMDDYIGPLLSLEKKLPRLVEDGSITPDERKLIEQLADFLDIEQFPTAWKIAYVCRFALDLKFYGGTAPGSSNALSDVFGADEDEAYMYLDDCEIRVVRNGGGSRRASE